MGRRSGVRPSWDAREDEGTREDEDDEESSCPVKAAVVCPRTNNIIYCCLQE